MRCEVWRAINAASNKEQSASNTGRDSGERILRSESGDATGIVDPVVTRGPEVDGRGDAVRKQRWNRDAYNRYQRDYMRRKRSGFIGIPYG
jgi:hypothetical protein